MICWQFSTTLRKKNCRIELFWFSSNFSINRSKTTHRGSVYLWMGAKQSNGYKVKRSDKNIKLILPQMHAVKRKSIIPTLRTTLMTWPQTYRILSHVNCWQTSYGKAIELLKRNIYFAEESFCTSPNSCLHFTYCTLTKCNRNIGLSGFSHHLIPPPHVAISKEIRNKLNSVCCWCENKNSPKQFVVC